jgi:putative DNA primase/helicase
MTIEMLNAALGYAGRGWSIFPAPHDLTVKKSHKSAARSNGARWGATRDVDEIRRDFTCWPDANIGIPTGADNGFWVLDVDTKEGHSADGIASLAALEARHGKLPRTLSAQSPTGSIHLYFKWPVDAVIKGSTSAIAPGIDVRGRGGMVIAPPSVRADMGTYNWTLNVAIAEAPAWLIELTRERPTIRERALATVVPPRFAIATGGTAYGRAALNSDVAAFAAMQPETGRNARLNSISFGLHQIVAIGELDGAEVKRRLFDAAIANGLVRDTGRYAVLKTIDSGARAGLQNPRSKKKKS